MPPYVIRLLCETSLGTEVMVSPRISIFIAFSLSVCLAAAVHADPERDAAVAGYLRALGHAGTLIPPDQLDNAANDPTQYASKDIEETGVVNGFVTSDAGKIGLFTVGNDTISLDLPDQVADAPWMTSGQSIRLLLKLAPPDAGSITGKPVLV